jgi:hypothetical protein
VFLCIPCSQAAAALNFNSASLGNAGNGFVPDSFAIGSPISVTFTGTGGSTAVTITPDILPAASPANFLKAQGPSAGTLPSTNFVRTNVAATLVTLVFNKPVAIQGGIFGCISVNSNQQVPCTVTIALLNGATSVGSVREKVLWLVISSRC